MDKVIQVIMSKEKETPRFWRFGAADESSPIQTIYIGKKGLEKIGDPREITVTITPS